MKNIKGKVVICVKQYCPFCKRAKELLDGKGVEYEEIDVLKNPDLFNDIKSKYNVRTVPQIFITDENGNYIHHIDGCDKLMDLEREGKLDDMLSSNYDKTDVTTYPSSNDEYEECVASHDDFI
ncbi:glutaredoxin [Wolbachia endosymbiont of Madathamugadia hiepei]|uniref:glutaredoxin domain-containing protein n=1 Tax=Wolbachia endosymbiont of Madathamugadia hiepei TaxID=1241303 RepID=UPI00158EBF5A|nr:glutaredoxin domain-containing protein [Wolbachia endosymbiont of Madathamugadia hiepei]NUX01766.1 glutaredoxin [Wolbachia endosymbiont of Madathamugadia hiepei]